MPALCRDCLTWFDRPPAGRCPVCAKRRVLAHEELGALAIAHMDCDAFYASVEKRDDPSLADKPLIVGGRHRGVVSTCCYIARIAGVRSAMPMFKALKLCPDAVVIKPRMEVYAAVSREIKAKMQRLTPLIEPLSLDEAFLDLSGTERLTGATPAQSMARLAAEIERDIGVTVSVGLSHNKYLAKIASDLDKPRGFSVIGRAETVSFLAPRPVRSIWGVGPSLAGKLEADGYQTNADLAAADPSELMKRYGKMGKRLHELSRGHDLRRVDASSGAQSISSETTFDTDLGARDPLIGHLWRLAVRTSDRAKAKEVAGRTVTLKLKTAKFQTVTRQARLETATNLADILFAHGEQLLDQAIDKGPFRLLGIGLSSIEGVAEAEPAEAMLFEDGQSLRAQAEAATDAIRQRFGKDSIIRGRALR
ncbi:DNA polymerase IV [Rhodobacteraceae bacterium NNCM2]|nr:DNA polymerase IV [Coraliihabitans acroporae]